MVSAVEVDGPAQRAAAAARHCAARRLAGGAALLLAFAARYGYHRDELYFLRPGGSSRSATSTSRR